MSLADYEARAAYDGFNAVKTATSFQPHLVLLDIEMPGMDGYATAHEIRRRAARDSLVLIAYTANSDSQSVAAAARAGFDMHVGKPCEVPELLRLLDRAVLRLRNKNAHGSLESRRYANG